MAKSRPTIMKRRREQARQEKRREKAARRSDRSLTDPNENRPDGAGDDYDPDIAHIVPGPQPIPWADEFDDEEEEEGDKEEEEEGGDSAGE